MAKRKAGWGPAKRRNTSGSGLRTFQTLGMWWKAFRGQRYSITTINNNGVEVTRLVNYDTYCEEGYKRNAVVFSAVREIARTAPSARIQVKKRLSRGQTEIHEEHPLQAVLNMPNPQQSHYDFVELLLTYLNLDGNAFILRDREGKRTKALWLPRPDKMSPVIRQNAAIYDEDALLGYAYTTQNGEKLYFLPEQVIHIKYPDPNDRYGGLGRGIPPLMAAAFDADNDNSQTSFIKQFFKNGAVPSGIIKSKNILDDTEVKRIQNRIAEQYTGEQNWHKIMVLDADAEFQKTGLNLDEMVFPDLRAISETRICAAFKVPPVLIGVKSGLDAATYSNYKLARQALWEDNIIPTNTKLEQAFTRAFSDELAEDEIIQHDYSDVVALQQDRNERFNRSNQAVLGGWIMVDEARREVGLGPLPNGLGEVLLRPLMAEPIETGKRSGSGKALKTLSHKAIDFHPLLSGASQKFEGSMIAFRIPTVSAISLFDCVGDLPEGSIRTPIDEMHITLALTGHPSNEAIVKAVASVAEKFTALEGKVGGLIRFTRNPEGMIPLCAHFDCPEITTLREAIIESLKENGIEPLMNHGFTPHITLAYLPAGTATPQIEVPELTIRFDAVTVYDRNDGRTPVSLGVDKTNPDQSDKERWGEIVWKRFDRIARAWENKFKDRAAQIFEKEVRSIEAAIRTQKGSIKTIDYTEIWKQIEAYLAGNGMKAWAEGFEPLMLALTEEQMADWAASLGIDWNIENPAVASFIREHSYYFAERISTTTRESIRKVMNQANEEGWSLARMIEEVQSVYGGWAANRAEMIARSETIRSSNAGEEEAFREAGIDVKEWYASLDERTCRFCAEMHGTQIAVGSAFQVDGAVMEIGGRRLVMDYGDVKYAPLHPDCRCTILPVVLEKLRLMALAIKAAQQTMVVN